MQLYKGSFNFYGETISLWTHAHSKKQAFTYFIKEIAFQLDRTRLSVSNYFLSGKDNYLIECKEKEKDDIICPTCGKSCKIIPLKNDFDYAGTHCTHGKSGTYYPDSYGDPVSDCCEAYIEPR